MNDGSADEQLLKLVSPGSGPAISDVINLMQAIDKLLPSNDGLKWFNLLYLKVTSAVEGQLPGGGWSDAPWLTRLDVIFAGLYFSAVAGFLSHKDIPASWEALFEARYTPGIDRVQFALAGMNAHINRDLAFALLQTDAEFKLQPDLNSPQHDDFERVNGLLESVIPVALKFLATGILGEAAQDTGKIGRLLAIWNVRAARDLAWDFSDHLRHLQGLSRDVAITAQDKLTGVIGRTILLST